MGARRVCAAGLTLIELLVAVVFIAVCAPVILESVTVGASRAVYAKHREAALVLAQNQIDAARSTALTSALAAGVTTATSATAVVPGGVTVACTISLVSGYSNLYDVSVLATWQERGTTDSLALETYVRAPDA